MRSDKKYHLKRQLFTRLKKEHAFWSYEPKSVTVARMGDNLLIEKVMYHLDYFYAVVLFDIKNPQRYLKVQMNKYIRNKINAAQQIITPSGSNI